MREVNIMTARPGEDRTSTFSLPAHIEANLTPVESAEKIASFFAKISQEYTPIDEDVSSPWMDVKKKLESEPCSHPQIEEFQVYENMKASKKTDSVPSDIPATILKEFLPEFTTPITAILKDAVENHT